MDISSTAIVPSPGFVFEFRFYQTDWVVYLWKPYNFPDGLDTRHELLQWEYLLLFKTKVAFFSFCKLIFICFAEKRVSHCIVLVLISTPNIFWENTIENYIFFCINLLYYEYVVASNCLSQSCLKCLSVAAAAFVFFCLRPLNHGQHRYRLDYVCSTLSSVFNIHINKRNVYLVYS